MRLLSGSVQFYCVPTDNWSSMVGTAGTLSGRSKILHRYNKVGMDIYYVVNTLKREGGRFAPRQLQNIKRLKAIWQEDDNNWQGEFPLPPHYVVETSPGHYHRYWLIHSSEPHKKNLALWHAIMEIMVAKYGSDPGAKDITRLMRVPGFKSHKRNGFDVKLIHDGFDDYYKLEHMAYAFGIEFAAPELLRNTIKGKARTTASELKVIEYKAKTGRLSPNVNIDILKSGEHVHSPIRGIMMHLANKGHDKAFVGSICEALIRTYADPNDERFDKALQDLPAMLKTTWRKIEEEKEEIDVRQFIEPETVSPIYSLSFPPGLAGKIMKYVYKRMQHPSMGMAFTITLGFLSSFLGRRFNVLESGLSTYQIVFAPTGYGKGQVFSLLKELTRITCRSPLDVTKYFAASGFTSPKAICNELVKNMCAITLIDEFGKYLASGAGDPEGVTRFLLEAYSACGSTDVLKGKAYSAEASNTPDLFAPALSLIGLTNYDEGTDKMIREAKDGFIPRCHIVNLRSTERQYERKPIRPHYVEPYFTYEEIEHLQLLRDFAEAESSNVIPSVIHIEPPDKFYEMKKEENELYNKLTFQQEDSASGGIIARSTAKVLRIAALFSICDSGHDFSDIKISDEVWDWARSVIDYEKNSFNLLIAQTSSESLSIACRKLAASELARFFSRTHQVWLYTHFRHFKTEHLNKLLFTLPVLNQLTRNKSIRKKFEAKLSTYNKLTMPEAIIKHWKETGAISDVTEFYGGEVTHSRMVKVYRFNPESLQHEVKL